jgi:hypothetical protein
MQPRLLAISAIALCASFIPTLRVSAEELNPVEAPMCPLVSPCSSAAVTIRVATTNDAVRAAGLDRIIYAVTVDVNDGKLTSLRGVMDAEDPQTAAFQRIELATGSAPPVHDDWARQSNRRALPVRQSTPFHDDWAVRRAS